MKEFRNLDQTDYSYVEPARSNLLFNWKKGRWSWVAYTSGNAQVMKVISGKSLPLHRPLTLPYTPPWKIAAKSFWSSLGPLSQWGYGREEKKCVKNLSRSFQQREDIQIGYLGIRRNKESRMMVRYLEPPSCRKLLSHQGCANLRRNWWRRA